MNTTKTSTGIQDEIKAELQETLDHIAKDIRDPGKAKRALERMNRIREENPQLFGTQDRPVELIPQTRDQA